MHTEAGEELAYDALAARAGSAHVRPLAHALTIDDARHGRDAARPDPGRRGRLRPQPRIRRTGRMAWPLPIYELALMTAGRAYDMGVELSITIVTPEDSPLAIFGLTVSNAVSAAAREGGDRDDQLGSRRDPGTGAGGDQPGRPPASASTGSSPCPSSSGPRSAGSHWGRARLHPRRRSARFPMRDRSSPPATRPISGQAWRHRRPAGGRRRAVDRRARRSIGHDPRRFTR